MIDAPLSVVKPLNHDPKKPSVKLAQPPNLPNIYIPPIDTTVSCSILRGMDTLPLQLTKWSDRLAFDVALMLEGSGESLQEVVARHKIAALDILEFNKDPVFLKKVEHYQTEIKEKGLTFRLKARAQAEELLTTSYMMIHDPGVSPAVKADLIKSTVKWAGLEPKDTPQGEGGAGGVRITINLGGKNHEMQVIEAEDTSEVMDVATIEHHEQA